ncbi:O-antigen ligase family protein [Bradyrhizobium sp. 62]|uniref:O-antigen ligase family protein n=1 Tax=Bradyrhizobium sp. 62 TaxID=1043588 RepID=UPI001FFBE9BE|nr:O-antigen ligase family protein [Bradyrhizobium sp. 62]MCK1368285.1 O-antigen ligase family protein [Bradyrhizobium sp. 62]
MRLYGRKRIDTDFAGPLLRIEIAMQTISSSFSTSLFSVLVLSIAVVGAPLFVGSTAPMGTTLWCIVLAGGLAFGDVAALRRSQRVWIWLVVAVVAAYSAVVFAQLLPPSRTGLPAHPIWAEASALLGRPLSPAVSVLRDQSLFAVASPLAALLSGLLGYVIGADRVRANRIFQVVAWSGAALALFAIVSFVINPVKLFWWDKVAYVGVLTTPFVNRNAAALYYGVCSVVGALLFWQMVRPRLPAGPLTPSGLIQSLLRLLHFQGLVRAAPPLLCLSAVLLTASRAGTVLALAGQVLAFTLYFWRDLPRRVGPAAALVLGGLLAVIVLQTLGGSAGTRFNEHGLVDEGRMDTYRSTVRMISDYPWLGVGLGGFPFAFPAYRTGSVWGVWDRAHNVLLEIAAEGGLPLAGVVVLAWFLVLLLLVNGVRRRRRDTMYPVAALSLTAMALVHATIDFSLQIPGFAIPTMAVIGIGAAQSFATRAPDGEIWAAGIKTPKTG